MPGHLLALKPRASSSLLLKVQIRPMWLYKELKITGKHLMSGGWIMIALFTLSCAYTRTLWYQRGSPCSPLLFRARQKWFSCLEKKFEIKEREKRFCIRMSLRPLVVFQGKKGEGAGGGCFDGPPPKAYPSWHATGLGCNDNRRHRCRWEPAKSSITMGKVETRQRNKTWWSQF